VNLAKIYAGLGEDEIALEQLEAAAEERSVRLPWLLVDPILDSLHDDPRYRDIRLKAGLPPEEFPRYETLP
jgi:hypothetical protein